MVYIYIIVKTLKNLRFVKHILLCIIYLNQYIVDKRLTSILTCYNFLT